VTETLLQTKLYIPRLRANLVPRPHLIERLNQGLAADNKFTLVSAPAGFGKSTLLSAWAQQATLQPRVAWLSLDAGDNDLARFLTYFVAALQTIEANAGYGVLLALQAPGGPDIEAILTTLLNEIAGFSQDMTLVLDDYHVIESPPVDQAVTFLLDHLPSQMHLTIATRTDPTLTQSRLRARGQMTELREADLRFTTDEVAVFLKQVIRLPISSDDVRTLEDRTEGWITGLQLAALAMQDLEQHDQIARFIHGFGGSHRYIIDYLVDEVLGQQTPQDQEFLSRTSILDRMAAPLCDVVTNRKDSQATLDRLEAANLFLIPLDDERRWYRYHHLFADLLRYHLRRKQAGAIPELHRLASIWHEQNGFITRSIDHAIAADDMERAARLVEEHYRSALMQGKVSTALGWLDSLPDAMVRSDPSLSVGYAWGLFLSGQMSAIETRLQDAETALTGYTMTSSNAEAAELLGEIATLRSYILRVQGDPLRGIALAQQTLELVPTDNLSARGVLHTILGGLFKDIGDIARAIWIVNGPTGLRAWRSRWKKTAIHYCPVRWPMAPPYTGCSRRCTI
jgi:LuxR family maltose regulon positive regulatory protein